jgi:transcription elongation factor GreB
MSKAFVKEGTQDDDDAPENAPPIPAGKKNYITPAGAKRLQNEIKQLKNVERPQVTQTVAWAAGNGDRSENADYTYGKKRLREIDRRLRFLLKRLEAAEIVDPLKVACDQVRFGATVTIRDEDDNEKTYAIVGVDEIDLEKGRISWLSPLASALMRAREGDWVTVHSPGGNREVEIVAIRYVELP